MTKTFKSWIPNVSGCLSFSNIKGCEVPGRAKSPRTYNYLNDDSVGSLYSLQRRNLSDALYSRFDKGGLFLYLLSARIDTSSPDNDVLIGDIYSFLESDLGPADKLCIHKINNAKSSPSNEFSALISQKKDYISTLRIGFKLHRDGFIELTNGEDIEYSFVLEAYSFLKDLVHSHKFHRYDDDAIIVPYPVTSTSDIAWINKTVRNLHKSIVSSYRNTNYKADLINALGRLSYLESFQNILKSKNINPSHIIEIQTLRNSLETKLQSIDFSKNGHAILFQFVVPSLLTFFGILIAMTQLLQVPCIDGLTFDKDVCSPENLFSISDKSVSFVRLILNAWYELAVVVPFLSFVLIGLVNMQAVLRWLNQHAGDGLVGWYQRVTFGIAIGTRFGQLIASAWVLTITVALVWLSIIASGYLFHFNLH